MSLLKIRRKKSQSADVMAKVLEQWPPLGPDTLGITDEAAKRIKEVLVGADPSAIFRVAIRGGGCSGLSLHYELSTATEKDRIFSHNDAAVAVDTKSLKLLGGATLHYLDFIDAQEFMLLHNPAAKQCSCGKSFSL
jgi:iron-sulfur cluster insertion protein